MKRRQALKNTIVAAGSAALTPTLLSLLQSCQQQDRLTWKPVFLNEEQATFISRVVDRWLPKTETPGALDMKVDVFIDAAYANIYSSGGQEMVKSEINKMNEQCKADLGNGFASLSASDQDKMLQKWESETEKFPGSVWGTAVVEKDVGYYRQLKSMALWAYFSSEEIGKNVLNYDPIPGVYQGCIPLSEVGKTWSLG